MIIDGTLVVSKKKKAVLIAELKKLNFKPFPKLEDAKKAGETEDVAENEEEDNDVGANDYDYLLGVGIDYASYSIMLTCYLDAHLVFNTRTY